MGREQTKQTFKLQLLALALALALLWYTINPTPSPISRNKSEGELPDEKRREPERQLQGADALPVAFERSKIGTTAAFALNEEEDDFEWPEFIDA